MDTFSALADPRRRDIIELLAKSGQLAAGDIYGKFPVSPQAVSQHLKILKEAKVVKVEKRAQQRLYQINPEKIDELGEWIHKLSQMWNARYDRLDKVLVNMKNPTSLKFRDTRKNIMTDQNISFTIERTFKTPANKVWEMWTTKQGLEKWFGPSDWTSKVTRLDVKVGGGYEIIMTQDQMTLNNHGTFTEVTPMSKLAYNWHFDIFLAPGQEPYDVPVVIELQEASGETKMTYTQGVLATPEATEGSKQGYIEHFECFAKIVEAGK